MSGTTSMQTSHNVLTNEQLVVELSDAISAGDVARQDAAIQSIRGRFTADQAVITALQQMTSQTTVALNKTTSQLASTATYLSKVKGTSPQCATLAQGYVKVEKPDTFDGTPSKLNDFQFKLLQYAKIVGLNDDIKVQQLASSLLVGRALTWWRAQCNKLSTSLYPVDLLTTMTVTEFFKKLQLAFQDVDCVDRLREELHSVQQTGDVSSYVARFRELVVDLGQDAPDEQDLIFRFISGLQHEVRLQVRLQRPKTLDSAYLYAATIDTVYAGYSNQQQVMQARVSRDKRVSNTSNGIAGKLHSRFVGKAKVQAQVQQQLGGDSRCQGDQLDRVQVPHSQPRGSITCKRCGVRGHVARHCQARLPAQSARGDSRLRSLETAVQQLAKSVERMSKVGGTSNGGIIGSKNL